MIPLALCILFTVSIALIRRGGMSHLVRRAGWPGLMTASRQRRAGYGAKPLLTAWERRALLSLRAQLPTGFYVCPQVRLADMLAIGGGDPWQRQIALRRVASYSVDFAIIELASGRVALLVELDDKTHDWPDRAARDWMVDAALREAGIPIKRFRPADRIEVRQHFAERKASPVVTEIQ
jgi:hypothetical protein